MKKIISLLFVSLIVLTLTSLNLEDANSKQLYRCCPSASRRPNLITGIWETDCAYAGSWICDIEPCPIQETPCNSN